MKKILLAVLLASVLAGCDDSGDLQKHVSGTYTCSDDSTNKYPTEFSFYVRHGLRSAEYLSTVYKDPSVSDVGGGGFLGHGLGYDGKMYSFYTVAPDDIYQFSDYMKNIDGEVNLQIYKKNIFDLVKGWFKGDFSNYFIYGMATRGEGNILTGTCFKQDAD